jgi:hypothetical protein
MNVFISGGAKNGKSSFAQDLAYNMAKERKCPLYYVATMIPHDDEDRARIERHRHLRAGKGFFTIEYSEGFDEVLSGIDENTAVLLEDLPNMLSCNMYTAGGETDDKAPERVLDEIGPDWSLWGEPYKRPKGERGARINPWYNRRAVSAAKEWDLGGPEAEENLPEKLTALFARLMPLFDFCYEAWQAGRQV